MLTALVSVASGQVSRNFRALPEGAPARDGCRRRAASIGLLKSVIAAVEARDHTGAAFARGSLGVDQCLHLVAPFRPFVAAANAPEVVQGAEDLGQPLQVAIERRGRILAARWAAKPCRDQDKGGQKMLGHEPARYARSMRWKQDAGKGG